jgi:uncharacterized sporulation protein YeaH/YhbH (DUF444 family)
MYHIVDRRLNPGGKSLPNRQRFLRRVKDVAQRAVREFGRLLPPGLSRRSTMCIRGRSAPSSLTSPLGDKGRESAREKDIKNLGKDGRITVPGDGVREPRFSRHPPPGGRSMRSPST